MHGVETTDRRRSHRCRLFHLTLVGVALAVAPTTLLAQERPVTWKLSPPRTVRGERIAPLSATIDEGWYLYSQTEPPGGPVPTAISVIGKEYKLLAVPRAPEPEHRPDRNFNIISEVYTDSVRFVLPLSRSGTAHSSLRVAVRYQACTMRICLPPRTDTLVAIATAPRASQYKATPPPATASAIVPREGTQCLESLRCASLH